MQTGYSTNKAAAELAESLIRLLPGLPPGGANEIVGRLMVLMDAAIGVQSHPGSPLTNN